MPKKTLQLEVNTLVGFFKLLFASHVTFQKSQLIIYFTEQVSLMKLCGSTFYCVRKPQRWSVFPFPRVAVPEYQYFLDKVQRCL